MPNFIGSVGSHTGTGTYDFRTGSLLIPSGGTLSVGQGAQMVFVTPSGRLALFDGTTWKTALGVININSGTSPNDPTLSGFLTGWYDATESTFTLSGSGVTQWNDCSVYAASNFTPTTPVFPQRGDRNGYSGIYYPGNGAQLSSSGSILRETWDGVDLPSTVIAVVEHTSPSVSGMNILGGGDAVTNTFTLSYSYNVINSGCYVMGKRDGASVTVNMAVGNVTASQGKEIITFVNTGVSGYVFASGLLQQNAPSGFDVGTMNNGLDRITIGGLDRAGFGKTSHFFGWIYTIAIFSSGLSSAHRKAVEKNLAYRYGITLAGEDNNFGG